MGDKSMTEPRTMSKRQRGRFNTWPVICRWCGNIIHEGEDYYSRGCIHNRKPYHDYCYEGLQH